MLIAKQGYKWVAPSIVVQAGTGMIPENNQNDIDEKIWIGFTVTKTVGNAVIRNRIRRRLKATITQIAFHKYPLIKEVVIIGRFNALLAPFKDIVRDLEWSLKKLNNVFFLHQKETDNG